LSRGANLEYFPYGETWLHNKASETGYTTPYKFTSKELDPETGLYYFGARYYDPVLSRWVSTDPPMMTGEYLPSVDDMIAAQNQGEEYRPEESLPGMGGVYKPTNIDMYHYAGQNPVKLIDPDGERVMTLARKTEACYGIGKAYFTGYAVQYGPGIPFKVYEIKGEYRTAGIRLDTGLDITFHGSDTVFEWANIDQYVIGSFDFIVGGGGIGSSTGREKKGAVNSSVGPGWGGSFSLPGTTKFDYIREASDEDTRRMKGVLEKIMPDNFINNPERLSNPGEGKSGR